MDGVRHEEGKEYRVMFRGKKEDAEDLLKHLKSKGLDGKIIKRESGAHDVYQADSPTTNRKA